jgi:subtilisin family serine protease
VSRSPILAAVVLALLVVFSSVPVAAFAASARTLDLQASTPALTAPRFSTLEAAQDAHHIDAATIAELEKHGTVDALVVFDGAAARTAALAAAGHGKGRAQRVLDGLAKGHRLQKDATFKGIKGIKVLGSWDHVSLANVRFTTLDSLLKVANRPGVLGIQQPEILSAGLAQSLPIIRQPESANLGYTGKGVTVAVLDTGVDWSTGSFGTCPTVPAAGCKVLQALDFGGNDNSLDDNGHGTNVAGIVAGVAPGANILAYDVFQGSGASDTDMVNAINQTISVSATYNVRALNMSIYRKYFQSATQCSKTPGGLPNPFTQAFADARAANVLPVVIAGNTPVANGAWKDGASYPGCTVGAVTVGATYDANLGSNLNWSEAGCTDRSSGVDLIPCFSQSASYLSILAPGSQITAAGITQSGTSQAAPHVAGAIAVLAAARPWATLDWLVGSLTVSGKSISDARFGNRIKPRLDLYAALASLTSDRTKPVFTQLPYAYVKSGAHVGTNGVTPVTFAWTATDASALRYEVYVKTGAGSFVYQGTQAASSVEYNLTPGTTYQVQVVAIDASGMYTDPVRSPAFAPVNAAENSSLVWYSPSVWPRPASSTAVGGYYGWSATTNAYAEIRFTGQNVAWVATTDTNRGVAWIYADDQYVATVNLNGSFDARKVQYSYRFNVAGAHKLRIVVAGTATYKTVDVDSFIVIP